MEDKVRRRSAEDDVYILCNGQLQKKKRTRQENNKKNKKDIFVYSYTTNVVSWD